MPVTIDQIGIPTLASETNFTAAEQSALLNSPEQPTVTFGSILRGFMDAAAALVYVAIDPVLRKMRMDEGVPTDITGVPGKKVTFNPFAGQVGRSLSWERVTANTTNGELSTAMDNIVVATLPKMSVESLVSRVLAAIPEAMQDVCVLRVNQATETVIVYQFADAATARAWSAAQVAAAAPGGEYKSAVVELSEPAEEGSAASLVFEGGSTS